MGLAPSGRKAVLFIDEVNSDNPKHDQTNGFRDEPIRFVYTYTYTYSFYGDSWDSILKDASSQSPVVVAKLSVASSGENEHKITGLSLIHSVSRIAA